MVRKKKCQVRAPEKRQLNGNPMIETNIDIGNIHYCVSGENPVTLENLEPFCSSQDSRSRAASCNIEIVDRISEPSAKKSKIKSSRLFEADTTWGLYSGQTDKSGDYIMTVPSLSKKSGTWVYGEFNDDFSCGRVTIYREGDHYFFYPFLEVLTINLLARGRGALLHACCIDDHGSGYLFLGQSGAGKSTMANIWDGEEGISVLSDDRVLVSLSEGGLVAHGTPWHGTEKYAVNACVPVKKIFFINHSNKTTAEKTDGIRAASELVKNSFLPFWDRERMEYSTEFLIRASMSTELFNLAVYPDRQIIDFVRNI